MTKAPTANFRLDPRLTDALIAVVLTVALQIHLALAEHAGPAVINVVGGLLLTIPLVARRRAPVLVASILVLAAIANSALGGGLFEGDQPPVPGVLACMVAFYSVGTYADDRASLITAIGGIAGLWTVILVGGDIDVPSFIFSGGLAVAIPWLIGRNVRSRRLRFVLLERERDQREMVAVGEERARIAREIHDVVAHSVVGMVAQAQGARRVLDRDPERAREALLLIERTGQDALNEMRSSLGILRRQDGDAPLEPQPGIDDLAPLIEQSIQAGLEVELSIEGEPIVPLPPGLDLSAYRIVQEALTNTIKHAGAVPARVSVRFEPELLRLEISNDGPAPPVVRPVPGDGGHGLVGMRERVELYGGELETGSRADGGFAVVATFPLSS